MDCIMLGLGTESGLLDYCSRIGQKFLNLSIRGRKTAGFPMFSDRHIRRRLLRIESLESRAMMSADGISGVVDSIWFASYIGSNTASHVGTAAVSAESAGTQSSNGASASGVNTYDWIIQFSTSAIKGITSVAQVSTLLSGSGINFQVLEGLGLEGMVLARSSGAFSGSVSNWLANNVNIAGYEQDSVQQFDVATNDTSADKVYSLDTIDAKDAWNLSTGSKSVVVAVLDTGVDYTHCDLAANIWTNPAEISGNGVDDDGDGFVDDVHGYNFVSNNGNVKDDNGHGTHVSGTIAAVGNNSLGIVGVNWSVSIMALKCLDGNGCGYVSDAVRAVNYATMMRTKYGVNVRVMNNSWGGTIYSSALNAAIEASNSAGIMFVAAAGNSAVNNDATAQYPASYSAANVISVAATDKNDKLASFSNYGATTVDLAAPGVSIYSTLPNNRYGIYSGTSMATPLVSGVAALCWAYDTDATVAEVKNAILNGVDKISSLSGKVLSGGRLNAYKTLKLLDGDEVSPPVLGSLSVSSSSVVKGVTVTLTAAGATSSSGIKAVYFYKDANGNGTYDSGDTSIGSDSTVVNGTAEFALNTSSLSTGAYTIFARAEDNNSHWSDALKVSLTVLPSDDYGNSAAAAAAITVGGTKAGTIETGGDQDWFKFQAVAGKTYIISVTLAGLTDSVLTLYGSNGTTQLAYNDDIASNNPASRIQWTATAGGTYYIKASACNSHQTGDYKLSLALQNSAPVLQSISDQVLSSKAGGITIPLSASDANGDKLTYSATAYTVNAKTQANVAISSANVSLSISGNQLRITRASSYTGVFYVSVAVSDGTNSVSKSFKVTATNATQQWLTSSSVSSLSVGEDLSQGSTLAESATAVASPALEANRHADWRNALTAACPDGVVFWGIQGNNQSGLQTDIAARAVQFTFQESNTRGDSWLSDHVCNFRNASWKAIGRGDQISDEAINGGFQKISGATGENAFISDIAEAKYVNEINKLIESCDKRTFETESLDEYFSLVGND
jgi:subtilisin family serine protease